MLLPQSNVDETTLVERRRGYRQPVRSDAVLRPIDESETRSIPVHVFELSMSGVGFAASIPLSIGTAYRLDLCDRRQAPRQVEIRSCRPRRDGMHDIGAQFC